MTYRNQSTVTMYEMSSVGKPTVLNTINIVTRAALGNAATPILVAVEAKLEKQSKIKQ